MPGFMGPKPPKAKDPSANEQTLEGGLMDMWGNQKPFEFSGGTNDLLSKFTGAAQNSPWGANIMKMGKAFGMGQMQGIPSEEDYFKPQKQVIDKAFADRSSGMINDAGMRNILGSGNLMQAGAKMAGEHAFGLGQARADSRDQRQDEVSTRLNRALGTFGAMGNMEEQKLSGLQKAYGASAGHDVGGAQMAQMPYQNGMQLLELLSSGRMKEFQQAMQQFGAQQQQSEGIFGPLGTIAGIGLMPGGFLL